MKKLYEKPEVEVIALTLASTIASQSGGQSGSGSWGGEEDSGLGEV